MHVSFKTWLLITRIYCFKGKSFIVRQYEHFKRNEHAISLTLHNSRFFINSLLLHNFNQHHLTAYRSLSANTNAIWKKKSHLPPFTLPQCGTLHLAFDTVGLRPPGLDEPKPIEQLFALQPPT